jgi:hypothetical protein
MQKSSQKLKSEPIKHCDHNANANAHTHAELFVADGQKVTLSYDRCVAQLVFFNFKAFGGKFFETATVTVAVTVPVLAHCSHHDSQEKRGGYGR